VLIVFAEAYGAVSFDRPPITAALADARTELGAAIAASGRQAVSARVVSPTFGGASWLAHAAVLAGVDTRDPADHALLLTTDRPTLVRHFATHGYRTVGWMPGLQRPWPEGRFYGFDRIVDADGAGYASLPFGFWRIPDQASMARIHADELGGREAVGTQQARSSPGSSPASAGDTSASASTSRPGARAETAAARRAPRLVVFATVSTHAPFAAIPPLRDDWSRLLRRGCLQPGRGRRLRSGRPGVVDRAAARLSRLDALPVRLARRLPRPPRRAGAGPDRRSATTSLSAR
jgi:hypothetical protein